jgi:hypothetical protein
MRDWTTTEEDSPSGVGGNVPWIVTDVAVLPGHRFHVRFIDGTEGDVDVSRMIFADNAGVFVVLRDPAAFAQAFVEDGVVAWPNGLDLAPDAMYDEIRTNGHWDIDPFPSER